METKRPRNQYPKLSTTNLFKPREPSLTDTPVSPGTALPAYGDEGAPPQYQEDGLDAKEKAEKAEKKAKARRTLFVRLLTSIFITVLVSLIVAAVVGRIHDRQALAKKSHKDSRETMNMTSVAVTLEQSKGQTTILPTTTYLQFTVVATASTTTTTSSSSSTPHLRGPITFDCSYSHQVATTTTTSDYGSPAETTDNGPSRFAYQRPNKEGDLLGVSMHSIRNCLVARASYRGLVADEE